MSKTQEIWERNRQELYQRAYQEKDNIKTNWISGSVATVGTGGILAGSLSVPSALAAFFGATITMNPIGAVAALAVGFSTVLAGKILNDKKKSNDVIEIYPDDKDFLPILFYPSIYLIKKIKANKLNSLEIEKYLPAEECKEFVNNFLNQEEREQEKMISESLTKVRKELQLFFVKESNVMCNTTKNKIGENKEECEDIIKNINKIISKGIDLSYFEKDGIQIILGELFLLLFIKQNEDVLCQTKDTKEELTKFYSGIRKLDKSSEIKTRIYNFLKKSIDKENDYEFLLNLPDDYAEYVKETLNTYKEEHLSKKPGSEKRVEKYIEKTVSELKKNCREMINKKNSLLENELIKFLFERNKQLENEHNKLCNTINKLENEIQYIKSNNIFYKLRNLFSKN